MSVEAFHRQNAERLERWPHSLLATSTHDTKRSEDVRARLNVLSELPDEWQAAPGALGPAQFLEEGGRRGPAGARTATTSTCSTRPCSAPGRPSRSTPEVLAPFRGRIADYMQKATKEAKVHTSWINPNEEYDAAVRQFVARLLPDAARTTPSSTTCGPSQRRVAFFGYFNSLAQVLLKLTSPGVPDLYQGDGAVGLQPGRSRQPPAGRLRPRPRSWPSCRSASAGRATTSQRLADELVDAVEDGRIKAYLIYRTLNFRRG